MIDLAPNEGLPRWVFLVKVDTNIRALVRFSGEVYAERQGDPALASKDSRDSSVGVIISLVDADDHQPHFAPAPGEEPRGVLELKLGEPRSNSVEFTLEAENGGPHRIQVDLFAVYPEGWHHLQTKFYAIEVIEAKTYMVPITIPGLDPED